ncbi:ribonuclease, partial [Sphingomonas solaris]
PGAVATPGPTLHERLVASGLPVATPPGHGPDRLEAAGWSELIEEATTGEIAFPNGGLRLSLTPAMTLFDVDGVVPPADLACAGAAAAARTIRRMDIGGSIGIDLPTVAAKADRLATAEAFDALLPQPFERTAVNGFGFLQIVRRRPRASLPELLREDPAASAARALLRRAERTPGPGPRRLVAAPTVIAVIAARPDWLALLERRLGATVALQADPALAIGSGHVHALQT